VGRQSVGPGRSGDVVRGRGAGHPPRVARRQPVRLLGRIVALDRLRRVLRPSGRRSRRRVVAVGRPAGRVAQARLHRAGLERAAVTAPLWGSRSRLVLAAGWTVGVLVVLAGWWGVSGEARARDQVRGLGVGVVGMAGCLAVSAASLFTRFLVVGLSAGAIYGLAGIGLVLTYRTAGVFNFAHGAVAALGAYTFFELRTTHGWPWPVALVVSVVGVGVLGGVAIAWLTRYLAGARTEMQLVATVGLLLFVHGFLLWKFGGTTRIFPAFLPTKAVHFAGVEVQYGQIIIFVLAGALAAGLYVFLRATTVGAVMRGVVDDRSLVSLAGYGPDRVLRLSWMLGSGLAALSGILIAPSLGLDSALLTLLVVQAFGACAIGLFSSLPLTYAGGLVVGVASALTTKYGTTRVLQGLGPSVPFLILFVALLVVPARRLATQTRTFKVKPKLMLPKRPRRALAGTAVGLLALVPWIVDVPLTS